MIREFDLSGLGFGGCPLGGHGWGKEYSVQEAARAVERAWELGVRHFDTADVYGLGKSEEIISRSLGSKRHEAVIASKFGVRWNESGKTQKDISVKYMRLALEASLKRLGLEWIPLYYIHWPDNTTPISDIVGELERCKEEGKIGAIGVSNFSPDELEQACQVADISAIQIQYSLVDRQLAESVAPVAKKHGVAIVTWGSLAQGLLTGKYKINDVFGGDDRRSRYENFQGEKHLANFKVLEALKSVANKVGKTPAQVAIRWLLDTEQVGVVLCGAKRPAQIEDNYGAIGWKLDDEDYLLLEQALDSRVLQSA